MGTTDPSSKRSFWWSLRGFCAALGALATAAVAIVGLFVPQHSPEDSANASVPTPTMTTPGQPPPPPPGAPPAPKPTPKPTPTPPPSPSPSPSPAPPPSPPPTPTPPPAPGPGSMGGDISDVQSTVDDPCCTFSVKISLTGFKGRECTLTATLVAADGSESDGDIQSVTAEADTDSARVDAAVYATTPGTYTARFVLRDPDGTELERFTTEPFDAG